MNNLQQAIDILCSDTLKPIVDMVIHSPESGVFVTQNAAGQTIFERDMGSEDGFRRVGVQGADPLLNQSVFAFDSLQKQRDNMFPENSVNHYPYAFERIAQVFDHKDRPDLIVQHTAGHNYDEKGGYLGEHGSLDITQSRAPFIMSGNSVRSFGFTDGHIKVIDVMPTLIELLNRVLNGQKGELFESIKETLDGKVNKEIIQDYVALDTSFEHIVVFLLDGCNSNILYSMIQANELPNLKALVNNGIALNQGTIASFPSVTLANHTSLLTGMHPGHHGVLHNAWWDKANNSEIVTESPATWHTSMQYLNSGIMTAFDILAKLTENPTTVAINEFADCGAVYSTFDLMRNNRSEILVTAANIFSDPLGILSEKFKDNQEYQLGSSVDHLAVRQILNILDGHWDSRNFEVPLFSWINMTLTDVSFHEGGPDSQIGRHALIDTDKRIGLVLDKLDSIGKLDKTLFVVLADHGMEETNPLIKGDWDVALQEAGLNFADESYGFIYFKN